MNVIQYSQLSLEEKKEYIRNCLLDGIEVHYKTRFGFIFLKDDCLYADFYDEISSLDLYNIRYVMFNVADKFAHIKLYKDGVLDKTLCWDVYNKCIDSLCTSIKKQYPNHTSKIFICNHKKDYRNDNRATASLS